MVCSRPWQHQSDLQDSQCRQHTGNELESMVLELNHMEG